MVMGFYGCKLLMESHNLEMFGGHWSNARGDKKYLMCYVIEGSSNSMCESSSRYVTTLPSLVAIGIVVVEI